MTDINEYQQIVKKYNTYENKMGPYYTIMGIMSAVGTLSEKMKRLLDESDGKLNEKEAMKLGITLGDLLKYIADMATDIDLSMENIILINLKKLELQKQKEIQENKKIINE